MVDLTKIGIRVSPLTNRIVIARFGKDPELALDTRNAENEFFHALCSYVLDHEVPFPGKGGVVQFGGGDEQFTATVRRFLTKEDANADTTLRSAAPELLAALKLARRHLVAMTGGDTSVVPQADQDALDAAIAKAEPRT